MATVYKFTFNPFQENTYIVADEDGSCAIFDPGCYYPQEKEIFKKFIEDHHLKPVRLINTHCHLDHVFGNKFVADTWNLGLEIHEGELPVLKSMPVVCQNYGIPLPDESPDPSSFLKEGEVVTFGNTRLEILFTPGHSPASITFYEPNEKFLIAGDVLFYDSIGRTDLPGGDYHTLINSIKEQLLPLDNDVKVYAGHGQDTTIGRERLFNPFLNGTITM
ncbi:MAG: MBL fold metallo-hydrolase [Saprospiraceae bacterium]|nr:MBL fold metallo-hydrolase [Saprospiraceae bacterium]